VLSADLY
jgi:hypothetical protein